MPIEGGSRRCSPIVDSSRGSVSESSCGGVRLDDFDGNVGGLPHRKKYGKARSSTQFAVDFDTSAVLANDRIRHRETEPGPLPYWLGRKKRLEDPIQMIARDSAPGIGKADPRFCSRDTGGDGDRPMGVDRVAGIDEQIQEHLVQTRRQALDLGQLTVTFHDAGFVLDLIPNDIE